MTGRLLITGADGFTGRHVNAAASAAGYAVYALRADLTDPAALAAELSGQSFTSVLHLAAISAVTHADELDLYRVNVFGTLNLLHALCNLPEAPRSVILASSANVYGNCPISPIHEDVTPAPVNHYAMSKLAMEYLAATYAGRLPLIITRPFNYTGAGHDERFVIPKLVTHFRRREPVLELGNIEVEREFNDVRSTAEAYLRLLAHGVRGKTYNICSGQPHRLSAIVELLAEVTGHRPEIRINPEFVRANEVQRLCGDPARLEACIGALPRPSLADTLRWMLEATPD